MLNVTDITGYTHCDYNVTWNLWCPAPPRFPGESGCGKLFKQYGTNSTFTQDDVDQWKNRNVRCSFCNYRFNPYEVYI